jgi:hypothetical protein
VYRKVPFQKYVRATRASVDGVPNALFVNIGSLRPLAIAKIIRRIRLPSQRTGVIHVLTRFRPRKENERR